MNRREFAAYLLLTACASAFAGVKIKDDDVYSYDVLNEEISLPHGVVNRKDVLDAIEKTTGYEIKIKVDDEFDLEKRYVDLDELRTVGDVLNEILKGVNAVLDVDEKRKKIYIVHPSYAYVDFPDGWDLVKTKLAFERKFPEVSFRIMGNRIGMYGTKRAIAKVAPVMKRYVADAFAVYDVEIKVFPYETKDPDKFFLGRRKYYGSEEYGPVKSTYAEVRHGDRIAVTFGSFNLSFLFDVQKGEIRYGDMALPFSALSDVGFVVTNGGRKYIVVLDVLRNGIRVR